MKILISEDNDMKFDRIAHCLLKHNPDIQIERVTYAKGSIITLKEPDHGFDILIQDMQLPINQNERIDIKGGEFAVTQLKYRKVKIKIIFCSSAEVDFEGVESVLFDYCSSDWKDKLIEFIERKDS